MLKRLVVGGLVVCLSFSALARPVYHTAMGQLSFAVKKDYSNYYSKPNLERLLGVFAIGGAFANTQMDQSVANWYQRQVRSQDTNNFSRYAKVFGDKTFMAAYVAALGISALMPKNLFSSTVGQWGYRSVRAIIVGWPPMFFFQYAFGSYRPNADKNSHWHPFNEDHGVSGHSFMGAIPWLTAAQMVHNTYLKAFFYAGSALTGWSRINDNEHYFSQAFMGWSMAYLAVSAVTGTEGKWPVTLVPLPGGGAVAGSMSW